MSNAVTEDFRTHALSALASILDPQDHIMPRLQPKWLDHLKRQSRNDRLFVCYHRHAGTFMLCVWVYSPEEVSTLPVFMEIEHFYTNPSRSYPPDLPPKSVLIPRLKPAGPSPQSQVAERARAATAARELERQQHREAVNRHVHNVRQAGGSEYDIALASLGKGIAYVDPHKLQDLKHSNKLYFDTKPTTKPTTGPASEN